MGLLKINGKNTSKIVIIKVDGTPIEISTSEEMNALLVSENVGKIYKYVGESNDTYINNNYYIVASEED